MPAAEKLVTFALLTMTIDVVDFDVPAYAFGDVITPKAKIRIEIALTAENTR